MTTPAGDLSIKANDRRPAVEATLGFEGGFVADLSTAEVYWVMRAKSQPTGPPKVKGRAVIVDAPRGVVRYDWNIGDTDTPGVYNAEWEVQYADGTKQTFPTLSYHTVNVLADLDEV